MHLSQVAFDVEQRLCALINFRCNAAGMCSGSSKARHVFGGSDAERAAEANELQQNYEVQESIESLHVTRRLCNRHSKI